MMKCVSLSIISAVVIMEAGCDSPTQPSQSRPGKPDVRAWVTGEAAAALDDNGHFILREGDQVESRAISRAFAARVGEAYIRAATGPNVITIGTSIKSMLETVRGSTVQWERARADIANTYYAESAFLPPSDSVPKHVHRSFGSSYLVPILVGSEQVALVRVAAYNDEIWFDEAGRVRKPPIGGGEYSAHGVHPDWDPFPTTPEHAVEWVGLLTGSRIAELPRLHPPPDRWHHAYAPWRLVLEQPVPFLTVEGRVVHAETVFVAFGSRLGDTSGAQPWQLRLYVADDVQPGPLLVGYTDPITRERRSVLLQRRPGTYGAYEEVDVSR